MDRRQIIKGLLAAIGVGAFAGAGRPQPLIMQFGAQMPTRTDRSRYRARQSFYSAYSPFKGASQEVGKDVLLYQNLQKEIGPIEPHWQGPDPESGAEGEGDCVGHAGAMGIDVLTATAIHLLGKQERWEAKASVEMSYASSRVEIGKNQLDGRAGSHGEWMAQAYRDLGVLHRKVYSDGTNTLDLTGYDPGRSRQYREKGVPDWLEAIARQHPVKQITNVRSGAEALDCVCAGQPVIICCSYAFEDVRDADGFSKPFLDGPINLNFRRRRRRLFGVAEQFVASRVQWWHAQVLTGALLGKRRGGVIQNSHGKWNSGPQPHDIPDGAYAVEEQYLDLMVKDWGDCWALGAYQGHEALQMKHRLYKV